MTKVTLNQYKRTLKLADKGLSLREIGKIVGLSHETVRAIKKDLSPTVDN